MDELKGTDITFFGIYYGRPYILTGTDNTNRKRYDLEWDVVLKALRANDYVIKKKRVRTHIIDVI